MRDGAFIRHLIDTSAKTHQKDFLTMTNLIARFVRDDQGQDIIEYALLAGFISLSAAAVLAVIGPKVSTLYTNVSTQLTNAGS